MWPKQTVRVVDAESGKPIADAAVRLVRYQHPHRRTDEEKKLKTNDAGEVTVERATKSIRTFPLMMHGVPGFSFEACAEAEGHAAVSQPMRENDDLSLLVIKLPLGSKPCVSEPDQTPPSAGKLRVEGVERDGARWVVIVAMPGDQTLRKGDSLGKDAKIDEVLFHSPPNNVIRRARVAVSGDTPMLHYGDLVDGP